MIIVRECENNVIRISGLPPCVLRHEMDKMAKKKKASDMHFHAYKLNMENMWKNACQHIFNLPIKFY